jgi:hypothetical protein
MCMSPCSRSALHGTTEHTCPCRRRAPQHKRCRNDRNWLDHSEGWCTQRAFRRRSALQHTKARTCPYCRSAPRDTRCRTCRSGLDRSADHDTTRCSPSFQPRTSQLHVPIEQTWPGGHALPHMPQCSRSAAVFTHCPLHTVCPAGHTISHVPARQTCPVAHERPHMPQLSRSFCESTHRPLHAICPPSQLGAVSIGTTSARASVSPPTTGVPHAAAVASNAEIHIALAHRVSLVHGREYR